MYVNTSELLYIPILQRPNFDNSHTYFEVLKNQDGIKAERVPFIKEH